MNLSSPLAQLDAKIKDFYKLSLRYFCSLNNLYGRQVYKEELTRLLLESDKITTKSQFEELILQNIQSNLRLNDLVINYLTDSHFSLTVKEFFDALAGDGTFDYFEQQVKTSPWEARWKHFEKTQEKDSSRVNPFTEEAQKAARDWLPKIKQDIIEHGKSTGYLPQDFDMALLLLPPREGIEYSSWNSKTKVFSLGSYGFDFFLEQGKVIAVPAKAYITAFHEILGHGAHQICSESMPHSLKFTEEIGYITPTKSITEGVAIAAEIGGYAFLKQRANVLGISEETISLLKEETELEQHRRMEYLYYSLVKDRELREEGFNGYNHLLELTQNPVLARGFKYDFKESFGNQWRIMGHALGPLHHQKMWEKVTQELGTQALDEKKLLSASMAGVWSREIYPEAVVYMLKN